MANNNLMDQWFDAQKKMAEQWQSYVSKMNPDGSQSSDGIQSVLNAQQAFFNDYMKALTPPSVSGFPFNYGAPFPALDSWQKLQSTWSDNVQKAFQEGPFASYVNQFPDLNTYLEFYRNQYNPTKLLDVLDSETYNVFYKMMDANQHFLSFYRYFDNIRDLYSKPLEEEGQKIAEKWLSDSQKFYADFVQPFIPAQMRQIINAPYQLGMGFKDNWSQFLGPWAGSFFELSRLYVEGANGDADKLAEYFELWKEQYNETIAPLLKVPGMGNNTEKIEAHNAFIDNSMKLIITSVELQQKLNQVTQKRTKGLMKEYVNLIKNNEHPQTYKEFYHYWSNEVEKTLQEYFYSDEFSQLLAKFGTANAQFVIARNKVLELALKHLPVVLESDARSLYKKVQDLKREVNKLKRELKSIKEESQTTKTTKSKAEKA